jgi:hypothetical protein
MPRSERDRGLPTFLLLIALATACSGKAAGGNVDASHATVATSKGDPQGRLEALGDVWFRTRATITYRTTGKVPGQPASSHQCLRQLVGGAIDRQTGLRMCSRQGRLKLTWDPPDRWRMDVTSPVDSYRILSTTDGSVLCDATEVERTCRSIPAGQAKRASPFGFLFLSPDQILRAIGSSDEEVVPEPGTDMAGTSVACFAARGRRGRVEWCYSRGGALLSFLEGAGADLATLEAVAVSDQVFEGDFELPAS